MEKICRGIVRYMALLVVAAGVLGALCPRTLTWVGGYVSWMLGLVMFGMGMTLSFGDFRRVLQEPRRVAIGVFAQFIIMPLVAYALVALFRLPPELAIGVILLGACPGGTASNVISYLARGDVALSVSMTMTTTLLAPVVTPALTYFLAGAYIEVSFSSMMLSIAEMVLAPVLLGLLVHHFCGRAAARLAPVLPLFSVVCIVLLVGGVVALSSAKLFAVGPLMALLVVLHNGFGLALGYAMARFSIWTAGRRGRSPSRLACRIRDWRQVWRFFISVRRPLSPVRFFPFGIMYPARFSPISGCAAMRRIIGKRLCGNEA